MGAVIELLITIGTIATVIIRFHSFAVGCWSLISAIGRGVTGIWRFVRPWVVLAMYRKYLQRRPLYRQAMQELRTSTMSDKQLKACLKKQGFNPKEVTFLKRKLRGGDQPASPRPQQGWRLGNQT